MTVRVKGGSSGWGNHTDGSELATNPPPDVDGNPSATGSVELGAREDHTHRVTGIHETGGPTALAIGAIADGEFLQRSGATVIGASAGGGGVIELAVAVAWDRDPATQLAAGMVVDQHTLVEDTDVGLFGNASPSENGVYRVPAAGAASRSPDFAAAGDFIAGTRFLSANGEQNSDSIWMLRTNRPTVGVDAIAFARDDGDVAGDPGNGFVLHEDFITPGNLFLWNWSTSQTGGTVNATNTHMDADHPGVLLNRTSGVGGRATLRATNSGFGFPLGAAQRQEHRLLFRFTDLPVAGDNWIARLGPGNQTGAFDHDNGVYFEFPGTADPNIQCKTAATAARTAVDSGISMASVQDAWIDLQIYFSAGAAVFAINRQRVARITTTLPIGAAELCMPYIVQSRPTSTLVDVDMFTDYYNYKVRGLARSP